MKLPHATPMTPYQGPLSDLVGRRVYVKTSRGTNVGWARYVRPAGDQDFLIVDLDGDSMGTAVRPEHVLGLVNRDQP